MIGGDGTHKGIIALSKEISAMNLKIGVCGLPKTIDNDIPVIDKSFGFETSLHEALFSRRSTSSSRPVACTLFGGLGKLAPG